MNKIFIILLTVGVGLAYKYGLLTNFKGDIANIARPDAFTESALVNDVDEDNCTNDYFLNRAAPVLSNENYFNNYHKVLCNKQYLVFYSGATKAAVYAAEHLTKKEIQSSYDLPRVDNFREDNRIPERYRARLSDYVHSGYDRGHLFPSADASNPVSQDQTFLLSNIVPQNSESNRNVWAMLEKRVRKLAKRYDEMYVVTGPLYLGERIEYIGKNQILVPTHMFKAVCVDNDKAKWGSVFITSNTKFGKSSYYEVGEFERLSGIDPFPDQAACRGKRIRF